LLLLFVHVADVAAVAAVAAVADVAVADVAAVDVAAGLLALINCRAEASYVACGV